MEYWHPLPIDSDPSLGSTGCKWTVGHGNPCNMKTVWNNVWPDYSLLLSSYATVPGLPLHCWHYIRWCGDYYLFGAICKWHTDHENVPTVARTAALPLLPVVSSGEWQLFRLVYCLDVYSVHMNRPFGPSLQWLNWPDWMLRYVVNKRLLDWTVLWESMVL